MKNNVLSKINQTTAKLKPSKFNLSHDVNTSLDWGSCQPLMCREVQGGSSFDFSVESLVRLAPMVSPTFGRMSLKFFHNFVSFADLLPRFFPSFEAQQPLSVGLNTYTPSSLPHISLRNLSALCLIGSHCTCYSFEELGDSEFTTNRTVFTDIAQAEIRLVLTNRVSTTPTNMPYWNDPLAACWLDWGVISRQTPNGSWFWLPMNNYAGFPIDTGSVRDSFQSYDHSRTESSRERITVDSADIVYKEYLDDSKSTWDFDGIAYCFRLSSFGKRLRKILLGLGYQINLNSDVQVSLMPLFAWYKSYFDVFGLTLYQGYETTNLAKLLTDIEINNRVDFDSYLVPGTSATYDLTFLSTFMDFVFDLGNCWFTQDQDYVSAHISSQAVSPTASLGSKLVDVTAVTNGSATHPFVMEDSSSYGTGQSENGVTVRQANLTDGSHAAIGSIFHGALDEEYLKRLYIWTNRNTIAGREIEKLLRAQGLDAFVDSTKPHFIGQSSLLINVSDVTATAESFNSSTDQTTPLGDYAGKGIAMNDDKNPPKHFHFANDETGFVVSMMVLVPDSGYTQGIDPALLALDKFDRYNPEFDGLGFEATNKLCIFGASDSGSSIVQDSSNFGFVPRYSGLKVANNVMNGDFNLRGTRSAYLPYTLDRFASVGDYGLVGTPSDHSSQYQDILNLADVPNCTPLYRQICRFPWLSNFNRIFVNSGLSMTTDLQTWYFFRKYPFVGQMLANEYDNFLCSNIINLVTYEPKLPLSDSFETIEEGRSPDSSVSKA